MGLGITSTDQTGHGTGHKLIKRLLGWDQLPKSNVARHHLLRIENIQYVLTVPESEQRCVYVHRPSAAAAWRESIRWLNVRLVIPIQQADCTKTGSPNASRAGVHAEIGSSLAGSHPAAGLTTY